VKVLLVDDHAMFRQGLRYILSDLHDSITFSEAKNCATALEYPTSYSPDLILLDLNLPDSKHLEALSRIKDRFEEACLVIVSGYDDPALIRQSIEEGAGGFVPKASTSEILVAALRLVLAGGTYLPENTLYSLGTPNFLPDQSSTVHALSKRQIQVLRGAIQGKSNKIIAREIQIAEGTVKSHLSAAYRIIGVSNRTEAVYMAARYGITSNGEHTESVSDVQYR
jgi:DNA-binding NarL/FixJ family response regulator